ncbi:hypothetical protein SAMN04488128_101622 [Chitinophaga eiseniae]|uniref:YD repeat-containing protein n=1 Tax=Chitinophaga eiseniae TaxID=634771 RepID=A0A1T4LG03_9BACT|nr:hypothetical protein [Chitinophaga eiseniae]SJZ53508.1 hypothetical protein SAMN04488128_101622 [Chitinophaga eiseniae]
MMPFMPCLRKYGWCLLTVVLLLTHACQCKKEHVDPPSPPPPPQDTYLVTSIRLNGIPKDSFVYNDRLQLIQRWDYNTSYRQWQNYIAFSYNADGYVKTAHYYNENDNTLKSLSQRDSLAWTSGRLMIYSTLYRNLGEEISGYDTTSLQINTSRQFTLAGSKDTFIFDNTIFGTMLQFKEYTYQQQDVQQFVTHNYVNITGGTLVLEGYRYTMTYNGQTNPLHRYLSRNPLLLQAVTADLQNNWKGYPYLASEHYVTSIQLQEVNGGSMTMPVTYTPLDTSAYPKDQRIGDNTVITYQYKIIKP